MEFDGVVKEEDDKKRWRKLSDGEKMWRVCGKDREDFKVVWEEGPRVWWKKWSEGGWNGTMGVERGKMEGEGDGNRRSDRRCPVVGASATAL